MKKTAALLLCLLLAAAPLAACGETGISHNDSSEVQSTHAHLDTSAQAVPFSPPPSSFESAYSQPTRNQLLEETEEGRLYQHTIGVDKNGSRIPGNQYTFTLLLPTNMHLSSNNIYYDDGYKFADILPYRCLGYYDDPWSFLPATDDPEEDVHSPTNALTHTFTTDDGRSILVVSYEADYHGHYYFWGCAVEMEAFEFIYLHFYSEKPFDAEDQQTILSILNSVQESPG